MEGTPWRESVLQLCNPEEIQFPPYREVVIGIMSGSVEDLEVVAARTYEALRESGLGPFTPSEVLEYVRSNVEGQPPQDRIRDLDRQIVLAKGKEQEELVIEKQELWNQLRQMQPKLFKAGRKGAPGS